MKDPLAAVEAIKSMVSVAEQANALLAQQTPATDRRIKVLDIGGGLTPEILNVAAMNYTTTTLSDKENEYTASEGMTTSNMHKYAHDLRTHVPTLFTEYELITEFGNWVHRFSTFCLSDVEYDLTRANKQVLFVHAGADLFMRDIYVKPRGYEFILMDSNYKEIARNHDSLINVADTDKSMCCDLAGPLCFAGDYLGIYTPWILSSFSFLDSFTHM
jgi:diaminopimelate decarboxylase